jgi:hypothetical protein
MIRNRPAAISRRACSLPLDTGLVIEAVNPPALTVPRGCDCTQFAKPNAIAASTQIRSLFSKVISI